MKIEAPEDGLGCQSVYRVLGVLQADLNFYLENTEIERENFDFEGLMVGSGALAVHADRRNVQYSTDTKDVDIYTNQEMADLQDFESFPHTTRSRKDGSQLCYDTTSASTSVRPPEAFVDVITDYRNAFEWSEEEATEIETLLEEETSDEPISNGIITVYLPSLDTLEKTFEYSNRDYTERIEMIDRLQEF